MIRYFDLSGQRALGAELAESLVLCRLRHPSGPRSLGHFSVCMREALLPSGEDETGEWERFA